MKKEIFKAYDIRAVVPDEMTADDVYKIGRAAVLFFKVDTLMVGHDMRLTSPELHNALIKGIIDQGCDVVDIGLCSTPLFYFAARKYPAGMTVTASHNPGKYNGLKICGENVFPIGAGSGLFEIRDIALKGEFPESKRKGTVRKEEVMEEYIKYNLSFADLKLFNGRKLKVVIDAGNGMGGFTYPKTFEKLKEFIDIIPLYFELDANFPNHEANPLKAENVKDLQKKVVEENADLGIAIDGDADRVMFIDENGEYISADLSSALIAQHMLKKNPGRLVLFDLRSSKIAFESAEQAGGKAEKCKVGHSFIKKQMKEQGALFAGELSGHYYYAHDPDKTGNPFFAENSIVSSIIIMNMMTNQGKKLSEIIAPLRKYFHSGEINSEVEDKQAKMEELAEAFSDGSVEWFDGVSVHFDDWWFNVRASNTEPVLRLNLEAETEEKMEAMKEKLLKIIRS